MTVLREHGAHCTPLCKELASPSPLDRPKPLAVPCQWCSAAPGEPCTVGISNNPRRRKMQPGHPSRLEAAGE